MADEPGDRPTDRTERKNSRFRFEMPTREGMAESRWLKPIAHRFLRSELWRFTRRSVPRGVALGVFAAFIVPIGQVFLAAFLALPAKANVPIAAATTFITNPFTIPFWLVVANKVGGLVMRVDQMTYGEPVGTQLNSGVGAWLVEAAQVAGVTAVGFLVLAVVGAAVAYLLSSMIWQFWIGIKRRRVLRKRRTP